MCGGSQAAGRGGGRTGEIIPVRLGGCYQLPHALHEHRYPCGVRQWEAGFRQPRGVH